MTSVPSRPARPSGRVNVCLGERRYSVHIGPGAADSLKLTDYVHGKRLLIVTNETVAPLYLDAIGRWFPDVEVDSVVLPDGERYKNLEGLDIIFSHLLKGGHDRKTTLVALGGGVIGDMTGFAAASYQRGVPFIQIPTSLLAQVDSSVGGKTGVNHTLGKNMIGAFYQPRVVIVDTDTLDTLPEREFRAGLAEVIKYGLIADLRFFDWLEAHLDDILQRDEEALTYAIQRSCQIKAEIVAADETEQGRRAILNFGHTFGHAIETFLHYRQWVHGEAISAGMLMALRLSVTGGTISPAEVNRIKSVFERCGLPTQPPAHMEADDFKRLMLRDKKALDGQMRLVTLQSLGNARVDTQFGETHLNAVLSEACGDSPSLNVAP